MDLYLVITVEILYTIASLILISAGLAVVFGMMKVINLAHGEFMTLGGYAAITAVNAGINIFIAIIVVAPLVVGLIGLLVERLIIRHLYGRLVDTMLATWGLSLCIIGLVTMVFGNTTTGISTPIAGFELGRYQVNGYNFFIIFVAIALVALLFGVLKFTRLGLVARGAMQNSEMAAALGYNPGRIYMGTFFCGAALAGLAGAVLVPLVGLVPTSGGIYIAKAFITVIVGGPSFIMGLLTSSGLFGAVNQVFTFAYSPVVGDVALLFAAIVLLRMMPSGITSKFFKGKM